MNNVILVKPLPGFRSFRDGNLVVNVKSRGSLRIKAMEELQQEVGVNVNGNCNSKVDALSSNGSILEPIVTAGKSGSQLSRIGNSTNIKWHESSIGKIDRQKLLNQKGCVIWITGLSGSGKSTVACALSKMLSQRGKLSYVLDGDNLRYGLNSDLGFTADDRGENIRRVGEVGKLFSDAGVICIACLISPYRRDREFCRKILPDGNFIEVFMDVPLQVCESRDSKGLYKLARARKIKGFTGIDDPYEPPLNCEISLKIDDNNYACPNEMAEKVISYLEENEYLQA